MRSRGKIKETVIVEMVEKKSLDDLEELHFQKEKEWLAGNKKLLGIIGHDIKSPMSSIIGFLGLLKNGIHKLSRSEIEKDIDIALFAAQKTFFLVDILLDWAIAENISKSYKPEILDFGKILEDEIKNIEIFISAKQIEIPDRNHDNRVVFADKKMVKSILRNLLNNAIKYSHKSGKIDITTEKKRDFLEVSIKDNGVGISKDIINTIFSSNNHISTLGTFEESGTGFGLLLCKEFIDMHKCKIWVLSKQGEGSMFKFTLPLSK